MTKQAPIIGIDLGTTFSAAAFVDEKGLPGTISNGEGEGITPSAALFGGDFPRVGAFAKAAANNTTMTKTMKLLLAGYIAFQLVFSAKGQFASDLLSGRINAQGVVTDFYTGAEQTPSMIVRADRIFTDYERKGFFRIGILPVGVMEGVTFEVHRSESITNSLAQMRDWLGPQAAKRLEFRKVRFLNLAGNTNRLESGRARIISNGRWELLDGVRWFSGTNQVAAPRATLQIAGKQTGQFILATNPPFTNNLFVRAEFQTTDQKETP